MTDGLQWDNNSAVDVLSAWIGAPEPCDEVAVDDSVVIRISRKTHRPVGIDIRFASRRIQWTGALDGSLARALLHQHGPAAMKTWQASRLHR